MSWDRRKSLQVLCEHDQEGVAFLLYHHPGQVVVLDLAAVEACVGLKGQGGQGTSVTETMQKHLKGRGKHTTLTWLSWWSKGFDRGKGRNLCATCPGKAEGEAHQHDPGSCL